MSGNIVNTEDLYLIRELIDQVITFRSNNLFIKKNII